MHDAYGNGLVLRFYESKEDALPKEFAELPQVPVREGTLSWTSDVINWKRDGHMNGVQDPTQHCYLPLGQWGKVDYAVGRHKVGNERE